MSTKLDYYFKHFEKFPFPELLDGITETYELLARARDFLDEKLTRAGICENFGDAAGAPPAIHGCCHIGEGTKIYDDVCIIGPVYIGKNCEIGHGAVIRPYTILSDGCSVGHGSEIKHTVMFGGAKVASLAFAGDCLLGASARIGSGVITANRKFDQSNATLKYDGEKHDLGDSFFGVVLGDSARLGANSVTQPGTHIGHHSWIYPLTNVRGFIPSGTRVYEKRDLVYEENEIVELKP